MKLINIYKFVLFKTKMTTLTSEQEQLFTEKFEEISKDVLKYGYPDDELIGEPCLRVRSIKRVKVNEKYYTKYAVGFIKHNLQFPDLEQNTKAISHICGNPKNKLQSLCIQGCHMRVEAHPINQSRKQCHKYIRDFEKRYNQNNQVSTHGTLTVAIINDKLNQNEFNCQHKPECFINYGKRKRS